MTDATDTAAPVEPRPGLSPAPAAPTAPERSPEPAMSVLPVVDDPAAPVSRPKEVRRQARRHFLQMVGMVGVGVGLAFTDALSTRFARPAGAAPYEMWNDCQGYFSSSTTCVPTSSYFGSDNCWFDWHREEVVYAVTVDEYIHLGTSCAGRNAWLWRWSADGWSTKCSDGRINSYSYLGDLVWSSFSICRTEWWY